MPLVSRVLRPGIHWSSHCGDCALGETGRKDFFDIFCRVYKEEKVWLSFELEKKENFLADFKQLDFD